MKKKIKQLQIILISIIVSVTFGCDLGDSANTGLDTDVPLEGDTANYNPGEDWTLSWSDEFNDGIFGSDIW
ncbi:MAG: hypothetical protein JEY91_13655, partial [Spirochaetaceae bacterium]|nr:hypothetical protein [Spirochaetaceae bacterium]